MRSPAAMLREWGAYQCISLEDVSQTKLDAMARQLNERRRKTTKHRQSDIDKLLRRSVESKAGSGNASEIELATAVSDDADAFP